MTSDEVVERWLAHLTARPPLGAVARKVWGSASDPAEHTRVTGEVCGMLREYVRAELDKCGAGVDARTLQALSRIVAKAMIVQHEFSETITNASCLGPEALASGIEPCAPPEDSAH